MFNIINKPTDCGFLRGDCHIQERFALDESAYDAGFKAYFHGIPAEANPYRGLALVRSERWLEG